MKISESKVFNENDYVGEFNLNRNERYLVAKALILKRGNINDASEILCTNQKRVYRAIFQHGLQDFLYRVRSGGITSTQNIEKLIQPNRIKSLTYNRN